MCAGGHADCRRPRVCRHMQVVRRIADDQCFFRIESQFAADSEYHFGRGFGGMFPRAGGGEPIAAGGGLADGVVQTRPPFARGDGKPVSLCFELVQTGQGIGKERHIAVVGIEVMCGISARDVGNGGFRRHFEQGADDFGQAVSDQPADALRFGRRKTAFGEAAAHRVDDGLGRIGKRAVPVEDDEFGRGHGRLFAVKSQILCGKHRRVAFSTKFVGCAICFSEQAALCFIKIEPLSFM